MKRYWTFTALLVTILLTFSLVGCGSANKNAEQDKKESKTTTEVTASKIQTEKQTDDQVQESVNTSAAEKSSSTTVSSSSAEHNTVKAATTVQSNNNTKTTQTVKTSVKPATSTSTTTATNASTSTTNKNQVPAESVTLSITGANDHPSILGPTKVAYKKDDTVFTVLSREADLNNIFIDKKGSGATLYIQGLEDKGGKWSFYEFDYGPKSGWIFKINGAELTKSAGASPVKAGDRIECIYIQ